MNKILVMVCIVLFLVSFVSVECATADRFVKNSDGTVTDTQTGLMWADHDNGSNINWFSAKSYCEGYSGGGKSGWRMPTVDELWNLYTNGANRSMITFTEQYVWTSETRLTHGSDRSEKTGSSSEANEATGRRRCSWAS